MLRLIEKTQDVILYALAVFSLILLTVVTLETGYSFFRELLLNPGGIADPKTIFEVLGAFLTVLIIVELSENILAYLQDHVLNVEVAVTTALIAVARKIIIFNFDDGSPENLFSLAAGAFSLALAYYLLQKVRLERLNAVLQPDSTATRVLDRSK